MLWTLGVVLFFWLVAIDPVFNPESFSSFDPIKHQVDQFPECATWMIASDLLAQVPPDSFDGITVGSVSGQKMDNDSSLGFLQGPLGSTALVKRSVV